MSIFHKRCKGLGLHLIYVGAVHSSGNIQQMKDLSCMAESLLSMISEGSLKVPVARIFSFSEMSTALAALEKEPPLGKFVVAID